MWEFGWKKIKKTTEENESVNITLHTYEATIIEGEPKPLEHAEIRWVNKSDLKTLTLAPADISKIEAIVLKKTMSINSLLKNNILLKLPSN